METTIRDFPNSFDSWKDTFYEVVSAIENKVRNNSPKMKEIQHAHGHCGFYNLAEDLTDEFEKLNEGRFWDGEFYDEIEEFLNEKLNG